MKKGVWFGVGAYILWGVLPVYWKWVKMIDSKEVLSHRIVWSFVLLVLFMMITKQWKTFREKALTGPMIRRYILTASLLVINWLTYIWAVGAGYIVETSLGYFINPLFSVVLGVVFLREKLRPLQWVAIAIAAGGVLYLTISYGALPWIALTLAFTFGLYGLIKKVSPLSSAHGLGLETGVLLLPMIAYLVFLEFDSGGSMFRVNWTMDLLLVGTGLVTVTPLLLFSSSVQRIPLSLVGILQFIAPSLQLLLAVFVYHEPFTQVQLIGFSMIWIALTLYWGEGFLVKRKIKIPATVN
ncbi:MAG: EamA family transporter RarD [Anaerolineaceae bacterium]|nr:EamA family transporter RarD [Anaerolineaceae bacterium]